MKRALLFCLCCATACDPVPSAQGRCDGLKLQTQRQLSSLLRAEQEYYGVNKRYTSDFAMLNWAPSGKTSFSFRIPTAGEKKLRLASVELNAPEGWPTDSWILDEKGGFQHLTNGCQTGLVRELEREKALAFWAGTTQKYSVEPKVAFRFLSFSFRKAKLGAFVIEAAQATPCRGAEKPVKEGSFWLQKKMQEKLNGLGAGGVWTDLVELHASGAPLCSGVHLQKEYVRAFDATSQRDLWLVRQR